MGDPTTKSHSESPAIPGRAGATSISRSQTLPSESHVPPQIQPEEAEVQASIEGANANPDESRPANRSIIDQLKECIPKGSNSVLERVIHKRPPTTKIRLMSDVGSMVLHPWNPQAVWEQVDQLKPSEHGVLIIDSINDEWCEALCTRYAGAIDRRFVLEHILGLDEKARWPAGYEYDEELARSTATDLERIDRIFPWPLDRARVNIHSSDHIDCWFESEDPALRTRPVHRCQLSAGLSNRVKINRFLSHCQLQENFCQSTFQIPMTTSAKSWPLPIDFVLIAPFDRRERVCPGLVVDKTTCVSFQLPTGNVHRVAWLSHSMSGLMYSVFSTCWPFFLWKARASGGGRLFVLSRQNFVDSFLLVAWFTATTLTLRVEDAEKRMRSLAYLTIEDDQERFTQLVDFRCDVGNCYDDLKRSQLFVKPKPEHNVGKPLYMEGHSGYN